MQRRRQLAGQPRLPIRFTGCSTAALALDPAVQGFGPIQRVVVEGIGDGASQLPTIPAQPRSVTTISLLQPELQRSGNGLLQQSRHLLQHSPHQGGGPPGILLLIGEVEHPSHQLTQTTAGEGKAHQRTDAIGRGELLAKPATGGPGVHQHLHRLEGVRSLLQQLTGQQGGQEFSPIAAVKRQQRDWSPLITAGTRCRSTGRGNGSWLRGPCTCTTASVSGQ